MTDMPHKCDPQMRTFAVFPYMAPGQVWCCPECTALWYRVLGPKGYEWVKREDH